jgi:hypothetical protein
MHHKDKSLIASKSLQADRKQLLKEIAANIEHLCLALSMVAPHLSEIHKDDDCKATLSFDTTWFQKVSGATRQKTQKPGKTTVATVSTKSTSDLERFFPKRPVNGSARANHATR